MVSSVEINPFRELNKLNDVKSGYFPSLFHGKISDPNSWPQWVYSFTGIGFDTNQDNVIDFLDRVIANLSDEIKEEKLADKQWISLLRSVTKLQELAKKCLSNEIKAPTELNSDIVENSNKLVINLWKALNSNESFKDFRTRCAVCVVGPIKEN